MKKIDSRILQSGGHMVRPGTWSHSPGAPVSQTKWVPVVDETDARYLKTSPGLAFLKRKNIKKEHEITMRSHESKPLKTHILGTKNDRIIDLVASQQFNSLPSPCQGEPRCAMYFEP